MSFSSSIDKIVFIVVVPQRRESADSTRHTYRRVDVEKNRKERKKESVRMKEDEEKDEDEEEERRRGGRPCRLRLYYY